MDAAASMIEKAIIANPTYAEAYNNLGLFISSLVFFFWLCGFTALRSYCLSQGCANLGMATYWHNFRLGYSSLIRCGLHD